MPPRSRLLLHAWQQLSTQLNRADRRKLVKLVCGPVGAMICYLKELRVEAPSPSCWAFPADVDPACLVGVPFKDGNKAKKVPSKWSGKVPSSVGNGKMVAPAPCVLLPSPLTVNGGPGGLRRPTNIGRRRRRRPFPSRASGLEGSCQPR